MRNQESIGRILGTTRSHDTTVTSEEPTSTTETQPQVSTQMLAVTSSPVILSAGAGIILLFGVLLTILIYCFLFRKKPTCFGKFIIEYFTSRIMHRSVQVIKCSICDNIITLDNNKLTPFVIKYTRCSKKVSNEVNRYFLINR